MEVAGTKFPETVVSEIEEVSVEEAMWGVVRGPTDAIDRRVKHLK